MDWRFFGVGRGLVRQAGVHRAVLPFWVNERPRSAVACSSPSAVTDGLVRHSERKIRRALTQNRDPRGLVKIRAVVEMLSSRLIAHRA